MGSVLLIHEKDICLKIDHGRKINNCTLSPAGIIWHRVFQHILGVQVSSKICRKICPLWSYENKDLVEIYVDLANCTRETDLQGLQPITMQSTKHFKKQDAELHIKKSVKQWDCSFVVVVVCFFFLPVKGSCVWCDKETSPWQQPSDPGLTEPLTPDSGSAALKSTPPMDYAPTQPWKQRAQAQTFE